MYQLGFGTDEKQPKIDFSIEDENFVPLMACIFISKQYILKQFKALGYVVRLPFNGLGGLRAPVKVGQF